jgi:PAS domain S-box-containing protein
VVAEWILMVGSVRCGGDEGRNSPVIRELVPHPYQSLNAAGELRSVNEAWLETLGWERDEVEGEWFGEFLTPADRARFEDRFAEFKTEGGVSGVEFDLLRPDEEPLLVSLDGRVEYDDGGDFLRTHCQFRSVADRAAYEERLETQRDNLQILNEVLRHDIRNDLHIVLAHADLLADHVDETGGDHLETIREKADHATELTDTAGTMADVMLSVENETRPIALGPVLHDALDDLRAAYPSATVTVDTGGSSVRVPADDLLGSVFQNLLTNAIQHNDADDPRVRVSVRERGETVTVRVADNGPGVPDAMKEAVFGRGETGLDSGGTGLGLYLVRRLVEGYGGSVRIEDTQPRGAVFVVGLPIVE